MIIVFVCGSLEPGKDGVGDYIRRLSGELISEKHIASAVALYDGYITDIVEDVQHENNTSIPMLRIPVGTSNKMRFKKLSGWIKKNKANWVSLQYVGYSFNNYGLPWHMLMLRKKIGRTNLHVMLHELWCGMPEEAGKKERLLGILQKQFLKFLLYRIKPKCISTSNHFYASELKLINIKANVVPIFSNIPAGTWGNDDEWNNIVAGTSLPPILKSLNNWLILGFFGAIYSCPGLNDLLQFSMQAATDNGLKLGLLSFGLNGKEDIETIAKYIPGAAFWKLGMLPAGLINRAFQLIHAGIITTPSDRLDKSGTAAALLERGIPILISPKDKTYNKSTMELFGTYQVNKKEDLLDSIAARDKVKVKNRLAQVVKFYAGLSLDASTTN